MTGTRGHDSACLRHHFSMNAVEKLRELGGVARYRDLMAAGVSRSQLGAALTSGEVFRPTRGVFAVPDADPELLVVKCANAELACINAARRLGLWILRSSALIHVSVNHARGPTGFRVHRAATPLSVLEICVQCVRCLPELDALCILESAVVKKLVTLEDLRCRLAGRRDAAAQRLVERIDPHSQSIIETVGRYHLKSAGFSVQSQVYVPGVGRVDLFVDGLLGIEVDGRKFHSGPKEFEEDRRRWNLLTVGGIPVLRVTYLMLTDHPDQFLDLVRRGLRSAAAQ